MDHYIEIAGCRVFLLAKRRLARVLFDSRAVGCDVRRHSHPQILDLEQLLRRGEVVWELANSRRCQLVEEINGTMKFGDVGQANKSP